MWSDDELDIQEDIDMLVRQLELISEDKPLEFKISYIYNMSK